MRVATEAEAKPLSEWVPPEVSSREFWEVRNAVVRALATFGSVGGIGTISLDAMDAGSLVTTDIKGVHNPDYYVVDDQYNDFDRSHIIEICPRKLTVAVIEALGNTLAAYPQWWCTVIFGDSRVQVFSECLIPYGRRFWDCATVAEIAGRAAGRVDYGPTPEPWPGGYEGWLATLNNEHANPTLSEPENPFEAMLGALSHYSGGPRSKYIDYDRHDLHPQRRLEYLMRFLTRPTPLEPVADDAGLLMAELGEPTTSTLCTGLTAMQATYLGTDNQGAFYFWTKVEYGIRQHPEKELQEPAIARLGEYLHSLLYTAGSDLIRLSAVLGLAVLKDDRLAADAEWLAAQREWPAGIVSWLQKVGAGGYAYPMEAWDFHALR